MNDTTDRKPKLRFPFRSHTVIVQVDYVDDYRVWSLWIEKGKRTHGVRLSHSNQDESDAFTVAYLPVHDGVLDSIWDAREDAKSLAEQLIDMLVTLATEQPSAECLDYLRWRLCEAIHDLRRRAQSSAG